MSFGILRRFLNPAASNSKSIGLRRFLNSAASDSKLINSGNGKLEGGSQCRDAVYNGNRKLKAGSRYRDPVSVQDEIDKELGRTGILMSLAGACVYLAGQVFITKPLAEDRRELLEELQKKMQMKPQYKQHLRERLEKYKIKEEEAAKEQKLLLEELEELKEKLKRYESGPNIQNYG